MATEISMDTSDRPCPHGNEGQECGLCGKENVLIQKAFITGNGVNVFSLDELKTAFVAGIHEARSNPGKSVEQICSSIFFS